MSISRSFAQRKTNRFVANGQAYLRPESQIAVALAAVVTAGGSYQDLGGVYMFNSLNSLTTFQEEFQVQNVPYASDRDSLTDMGAQFTAGYVGSQSDLLVYRLVKKGDITLTDGPVGYVLVQADIQNGTFTTIRVARV